MSLTRRYFLKIAAAAGATTIVPEILHAQDAPQSNSPNERIRAAIIGCGGRGSSHVSALVGRSDVDIAYLSDVDTTAMVGKARTVAQRDKPEPKMEQDFRRILDDKSIDVVTTATPNHWHSLICILAMQSGKHIYSEKPLSHNVWEGRQVDKWSTKLNKLCQCGTQSRSSLALKAAWDYVHVEKALGAVKYVIGTCYKPRGTIGKLDKPLEIPANIDYDLWCGPAEKVDLYRPKLHYDWHWDYNTGNGDMGNQGIHQMDVARWFLNEQELSPKVMSIGGRVGYDDAGNSANTQIVYHGYAKAPMIFETRGLRTAGFAHKGRNASIGDVVVCEKGFLVLTDGYNNAAAYNEDGSPLKAWSTGEIAAARNPQPAPAPVPEAPAEGEGEAPAAGGRRGARGGRGGGGGGGVDPTTAHFTNFLEAVRANDRKKLNADCLEGHLSSALCHTGTISYRLGKNMPDADIREQVKNDPLLADSYSRMAEHMKANNVDVNDPKMLVGPWLTMDPKTERFTNSEAANALISRPYRAGYVVPSADA